MMIREEVRSVEDHVEIVQANMEPEARQEFQIPRKRDYYYVPKEKEGKDRKQGGQTGQTRNLHNSRPGARVRDQILLWEKLNYA